MQLIVLDGVNYEFHSMKRGTAQQFAANAPTSFDVDRAARWRKPTDCLPVIPRTFSRRVSIALAGAVGAYSDVILYSSRV